MAAVACHTATTTLRAVQSHGVTLDNSTRGRTTARCAASWCGGAGARLRATGAGLTRRTSSSVRFSVAAAVADEAVAASPADSAAPAENLSMYFKAEGSLNENAVAKVTKVLEGAEGVSQIKVYVEEGAATVELVKQTNIQATGVASSLVELIEQAGFKMQALSLGFDDDDAEDDEYIDYDASTYTEEEAATAE